MDALKKSLDAVSTTKKKPAKAEWGARRQAETRLTSLTSEVSDFRL